MNRYLLFSLLFFPSFTQIVAQSPWIPKTKGGFAQLGFSGLFYDQARIGGEVKATGQQNADLTYQLYVDYGLTKKIGLTFILPYKNISFTKNGATNTLQGFSNVILGAKYLVLDKSSKISIGLTSSFNTAKSDKNLGLRTGYETNTFMPYVTVGTGTKKMYFYSNLGYGKRTNGYSDFVKLSGEMGYKLLKHGYFAGFMDFNVPTNSSSEFYKHESLVYFNSSNYLDRQLFTGLGLKLIVDIKPERYGFILSSIGSLKAENIPFARSYNLGIYAKY